MTVVPASFAVMVTAVAVEAAAVRMGGRGNQQGNREEDRLTSFHLIVSPRNGFRMTNPVSAREVLESSYDHERFVPDQPPV